MFSRQHYNVLAEVLASVEHESNGYLSKADLISRLNRVFLSDNPNFQPSRFEKACEPRLQHVEECVGL